MQPDWPQEVHRALSTAQVRIVGYVPDAGHQRLIELCQGDRKMRSVVLTTEEEGEFNSWQVPMGEATPAVLEAMGISVQRAARAEEVAPLVGDSLKNPHATAVLISQLVIGVKSFQE